ncbi:site-specific integrase [Uliginosibacterium sp. TH139]|uniref:site-specific integrase n=1 Tax=Uliginosibacterium sp. TH139 TaxID=2067453 RepID=UPI00117FF13E|nr:site-specific integrase [Uliginosibacterium sp. TH139]
MINNNSSIIQTINSGWSLVRDAFSELPMLPSALYYWDDFDESRRKIDDFKNTTEIQIIVNGTKRTTSLIGINEAHAFVIKHVIWHSFSQGHRPATVDKKLYHLKNASEDEMLGLMTDPHSCKKFWPVILSRNNFPHYFSALKSMLSFFCAQYLFDWSPEYLDFLGTEFPVPSNQAYESVASGDAFLEQEIEKLIINFFDELSVSFGKVTSSETCYLEDSAMLMCAYQFGMRPIQIASLKIEDVKLWGDDSDGSDSSIHVRFAMAKQRSSDKILYLPRKIKAEWSVVWRELIRRKSNSNGRFFSVTSSQEAGSAISRLAKEITGEAIAAGVFRHSAAQRLVDGGASSEELAAFMGHSSLQTGLIYYRASPAQAELVNKALGISAVYKKIQHIAHAKFISKEDLATLKGEQQIGGIPHGIPIAGIGGCTTGQPACPYNPVTACYGCSRFMPVVDIEMHKKVLQDFREVARFFFDESKAESSSPAYLQLKRTITSVEAIIDELEGRGHE